MPVNSQHAPVPGQFPVNQIIGSGAQSATFSIPLNSLPSCYIIAAHASAYHLASDGSVDKTETVWGFGDPFRDTDKWGWTVPYCTQACD